MQRAHSSASPPRRGTPKTAWAPCHIEAMHLGHGSEHRGHRGSGPCKDTKPQQLGCALHDAPGRVSQRPEALQLPPEADYRAHGGSAMWVTLAMVLGGGVLPMVLKHHASAKIPTQACPWAQGAALHAYLTMHVPTAPWEVLPGPEWRVLLVAAPPCSARPLRGPPTTPRLHSGPRGTPITPSWAPQRPRKCAGAAGKAFFRGGG